MANGQSIRGGRFPAISFRQPAADEILSRKRARDRRSRPSRFRGWILVHASSARGDGAREAERGKILGMVELADCVADGGGWEYVWRKPRRFRSGIAFRGHYSIPFYVPVRLLHGTAATKVTPGELVK